MSKFERKPRSELRHWSTYGSVLEWYEDYREYVPITMAHGLSQFRERHPDLTFRDAYRSLLHAGAIIHVDPANDIEPDDAGPDTSGGADAAR